MLPSLAWKSVCRVNDWCTVALSGTPSTVPMGTEKSTGNSMSRLRLAKICVAPSSSARSPTPPLIDSSAILIEPPAIVIVKLTLGRSSSP